MGEKHVSRILVTLTDAKNVKKIAYFDPALATLAVAITDTLNTYEHMLTQPIQVRTENVSVPVTIEE